MIYKVCESFYSEKLHILIPMETSWETFAGSKLLQWTDFLNVHAEFMRKCGKGLVDIVSFHHRPQGDWLRTDWKSSRIHHVYKTYGSVDALSLLSLSRRNNFADLRRACPNNRHLLTPCQADTFYS